MTPSAETIRATAAACERVANLLHERSDDLLNESAQMRRLGREVLAMLQDDQEFQAMVESADIVPIRGRKSA